MAEMWQSEGTPRATRDARHRGSEREERPRELGFCSKMAK
jgi:hypothetical protein